MSIKDRLPTQKRLALTAVTTFFLLTLLLTRYYFLQVIQHEKWEEVARRQHFYSVVDPFERGSFYTSFVWGSPKKIVYDVEKFHLYLDPLALPVQRHREITQSLSPFLCEREREKLPLHLTRHSRSRQVGRWLEQSEKEQILNWWHPFAKKHQIARNALYFIPQFQRNHPYGPLLGQVLHTVKNRRDEQTGQALPTGGLELYFQNDLKGSEGKRLLKRSPKNAFETGDVLKTPKDGKDIYLTIDHILQTICEEEIERAVEATLAKKGWAIMMVPTTGEVLALAQYPFFDPRHYQSYYNDPERTEHTKVKGVTDAQEPGSVMKPITAAIAFCANQECLKKGLPKVLYPEEKCNTSNGKFPGRSKPLKDVTKHNYLNLDLAMQKSSNVYFARQVEKIIDTLGPSWYRKQLVNRFGLGQQTGIELPAESAGLVPRIGKRHPNGSLEWSRDTPYSLAMGHNLLTTGVQVARAYCVLANRGYLVTPFLVKKIVDKEGEKCVVPSPSTQKKVLDKEIAERVIRAMRYVTKPGGAAWRAAVAGYTAVGKTGTANKVYKGSYSEEHTFASFVGFAPVEKPAFVLFVGIDEPKKIWFKGSGKNHHGSSAAAPTFSRIARRALHYLGIPEDNPGGYPKTDPRFDPKKSVWAEEVEQLQKIYRSWNK